MNRTILIDTLEKSIFWVPDVPGRVERLSVLGLAGYTMAHPDPLATLLGGAAFDDAEADRVIDRLKEKCVATGRGATWTVGPSSLPHDLETRLDAAGFTRIWDMEGMALTDLDMPAPPADGLVIRLAAPGDVDLVARTAARGFDMSEDLLRLYAEARLTGDSPSRTRVYLAFPDGGEEPVAYANLDYVPGTPVFRLGGAAVFPEHRGRGVYSSLLARRLADARAMGMTAAVIQAQRTTSAPICRKLGFETLCPMSAYSWAPGV